MNTPKIQLLLVDDNPMDAALAQCLLQTLDKELPVVTRWVDSAEKAMAEIQRQPYDLLLLDYQLPGASGLDVLAELRKLVAQFFFLRRQMLKHLGLALGAGFA